MFKADGETTADQNKSLFNFLFVLIHNLSLNIVIKSNLYSAHRVLKRLIKSKHSIL